MWHRPVEPDAATELMLRLEPGGLPGGFRLVWSGVTVAEGRATAGQAGALAAVDDAGSGTEIDAARLYALAEQRGIAYGPRFRIVRSLRSGADAATADVTLVECETPTVERLSAEFSGPAGFAIDMVYVGSLVAVRRPPRGDDDGEHPPPASGAAPPALPRAFGRDLELDSNPGAIARRF